LDDISDACHSYNKLNGTHTTEHPFLKEILRDEWAYNGCLVSDWFATKSCATSVNAGTWKCPVHQSFVAQSLQRLQGTGLLTKSRR
jgi:beta-glucosidase-like glycosyl hydrolase